MAFGMVLLQGINGPQCTGQPMWLPCQKWHPLMVCTLLAIYLASSHWLPCKGADSLHPAWQPVTGSIKLQVPDPHVQCHGGSYESFGDGELNGSPPCLGWPSQVTGWATPLPPYLPLWGKPCFQPSGTGWKKGVVPMGMDSVA